MNAAADLLRAALDEEGVSQALLAYRTGLTPKHINQLVHGKAPLSVAVALRLQLALSTVSAEDLMVAQARDQVRRAWEQAARGQAAE